MSLTPNLGGTILTTLTSAIIGVAHRRVTKRHANDAECHAPQRVDGYAYGQTKNAGECDVVSKGIDMLAASVDTITKADTDVR